MFGGENMKKFGENKYMGILKMGGYTGKSAPCGCPMGNRFN